MRARARAAAPPPPPQQLSTAGWSVGDAAISTQPSPPPLPPHPTLRLLRDRERAAEPLDAVKWLCREFWGDVFRKPVDRLQTNNRGVFVLQDHAFRWAKFVSGGPGQDSRALALKYLLVPCGLLRGALAAWGLEAAVNVDVSQLPKGVFHVRLLAAAGGGSGGGGPAAAAAAAAPAPAAVATH